MAILPNFDALRDLHNSANNLLHSPIIQKSIFHHQQKNLVHDISETSLKLLDKCSTTKDILILVKNHLQALQTTFRRISASETIVKDNFEDFYIQKKKLKKQILKQMHSLKGVSSRGVSVKDKNLGVVVNALREVRETTLSIMESLISLMAMPNPESKISKGYFGKLRRVNSLLFLKNCDATMVYTGSKRLEAVEIVIEDFEIELECMFRRLIQTRVSLLNILTNWINLGLVFGGCLLKRERDPALS